MKVLFCYDFIKQNQAYLLENITGSCKQKKLMRGIKRKQSHTHFWLKPIMDQSDVADVEVTPKKIEKYILSIILHPSATQLCLHKASKLYLAKSASYCSA